jgi:uncharacterized protein YlxW (UPF0749 family)
LRAYRQTLAEQNHYLVNKLIKRLRQRDRLDGSALKKQVDELQERLRKLEHELETLQARVKAQETRD